MKKLILTSPQFEGEIEVLYNDEKQLVQLDMINADIDSKQVEYLKRTLPVAFLPPSEFKAVFKSETLSVVEVDYKITFDMFWDKYSMKRNRDRSEKLWEKLSQANKIKAFSGLNGYLRHLAVNTWKTKADPDTYLKNQYWLNEWK